MKATVERRHDTELRAVIDRAIEFKRTLGQSAAASFLVEHYVPPPLLQRVLMRAAEPSSDTVARAQGDYSANA